jgi:ammonium transporter Rh
MIYVGFGFLMVFLKQHSWTSVGYNFIIAAYVAQLTILVVGFWHMLLVEGPSHMHKINLDIPALIIGDFGAGAVLITFGAILGKCSLAQLWCLATLEVIFYGLNEAICAGVLMAVDMGGSMYVHTFGAYFGLAATYFFKKEPASKMIKAGGHANLAEGNYTSQYVAMIGTLFLWMFWPSFNGALAIAYQQQRVIVNTVLAISASCVSAVGVSRLWMGKLDMEVVLNATLAGGVSVGSSSDLVVTGAIAMAIGTLAGVISAIGFLWLSGKL